IRDFHVTGVQTCALPISASRRSIGARLLCQALEREGVDLIFGYPGGAVIPLYDVLPEFNIHHVLVRHEQGAAHAADGYARATGRSEERRVGKEGSCRGRP